MPYYLKENWTAHDNRNDELVIWWVRENVADEAETTLGRRPTEDELDDICDQLKEVYDDTSDTIREIVMDIQK